MNHFHYKDGELLAEDVPIARIAEAVGTPFYCYSTATLERHYRVFAEAFGDADTLVCYSLKANSNLAVVRTLARLGAGADVVSGGELRRALAAGVPASRIVFSGVGKTAAEMADALAAGIYQFNVESEPELRALNDLAEQAGRTAPVTIRVNPDVDARSHDHISTGREDDKFGVAWRDAREMYRLAGTLGGLQVVGIDVHIGSQLTELEPFKNAFGRIAGLVGELRADGHAIERLDLGGGLGISYGEEGREPPLPEEYARLATEITGELGCQLVLEPGRLIAGNAGLLVTRVIYVKQAPSRTFVIVDAAMNDLHRPALYGAYHEIEPVRQPGKQAAKADPTALVDVVGPVCESADVLGRERALGPVEADDLLVIRSAGAYGAVMSSSYNSRPLVPEVLVNGDRFAVIRKRPDYDEMVAGEEMPDWLGEDAAP